MSGAPVRGVPGCASCVICQAWEGSPPERAFSSGAMCNPTDAHSHLVLGWMLGRTVALNAHVCEVHTRQLAELSGAWVDAILDARSGPAGELWRKSKDPKGGAS